MKTLVQFIKESKKQSGKSNWQTVLNRMLWQDKVTKADFDEVQQDDWIWDDSTGEVATTEFLMDLYTKFKNEKVEWEAEDLTNAIAYTIKDKKGHSISFDSTEELKF